MIYVALLRGINVGGNNKIAMSELKATFEKAGMTNVSTYINSGNVIFEDTSHSIPQLTKVIESAIERDFGFAVKVLIRDLPAMEAVIKTLPDAWVNDDAMKCDVMFLWET